MEMCNCGVTGLFITVSVQTIVLLHCDRTMLLLCLFSETCYYSVTELWCCSICLQNNIIAVSVYIIVLLQCLSKKLLLWCLSSVYRICCFSVLFLSCCRMCVEEVILSLQNHAERPVQVLVDSSKSSDRSAYGHHQLGWVKVEQACSVVSMWLVDQSAHSHSDSCFTRKMSWKAVSIQT